MKLRLKNYLMMLGISLGCLIFGAQPFLAQGKIVFVSAAHGGVAIMNSDGTDRQT